MNQQTKDTTAMQDKLNNDILDIAEDFQKDAHNTIELIKSMGGKSKFEYQDLQSVWTFRKLAELEYRIRKIENFTQTYKQ